jgi:hypothetical protein
VKDSSREGFIEPKIELGDEDFEEILRADLERPADFDVDEVEVVNNRRVSRPLIGRSIDDQGSCAFRTSLSTRST